MIGTPPSSRPRPPRGEITWVGVLLLALLLGGAYFGKMWGPAYLLHMDVKYTTRATINEGVHQRDDQKLVRSLCDKLAALGHEEVVDEQGRVTSHPLVDVRPGAVTWERDAKATPARLHAAFEYVRAVRYPWTDQVAEKTFSVDITQDIDVPRW